MLAQAGVLDGQALRVLARYHRPVDLDPHGRVGAEAIADFELVPWASGRASAGDAGATAATVTRSRHPWSDDRERRSVEDARPRCRAPGSRRSAAPTGALAKAYHPDAAGEAALPRFLAIQAAYEQLSARPRRRAPAAAPRGRHAAARALASGSGRARAALTRRRPASGARPTGRPGQGAGAGRIGSRPGAERPGTADAAAPVRPARCGRPAGAAGAGASARRRPSGRRRAPNKATPYSTSYDGRRGALRARLERGQLVRLLERHLLDHQPEGVRRPAQARPGVPAPGTAPRERLDPGRRGTRRRGGNPDPGRGPASRRREATWTTRRRARRPSTPGAVGPGSTTRRRAGAGHAAAAMGDAPPSAAAHRPNPRDWFEAPPPDRGSADRLAPADDPWAALGRALSRGRRSHSRRPWRSGRRPAAAASPPPAARLSSPGTWIVQTAIFRLLLALPRVAAWLAHGTLATAVIGIPTAIVLSAGGGSRVPEASALSS